MTIPHIPITPIIAFDINDFTDGSIDGDGVFDKMMTSDREHLQREHDTGRITGDKFADVYLGTLQTVLQTANQYALTQSKVAYEVSILSRQAEHIDQQTELTIEQIATQVEQTSNVTAQTEYTNEQTTILTKQQGFTPMG